MTKRAMVLAGLFLAVLAVSAAADIFDPAQGFFDSTPVWRMLDYSADTLHSPGRAFRVVGMVLEQSTGEMVLAFEEFDTTTGIATGRTSMHYRRDTKLGHCVTNDDLRFPVPCISGTVIP